MEQTQLACSLQNKETVMCCFLFLFFRRELDTAPASAVTANQQKSPRHRLSPDHEHVEVKRIRANERVLMNTDEPCSSSQEDRAELCPTSTVYGMLVVLG